MMSHVLRFLIETPSAEERFQLGLAEFMEENYLEALNHFEVIRLQFPGSSVADSARYYTGLARFEREEYLLASFEFNQLLQGSASRDLLPESYYMFAQCYYEMSPKPQLDQSHSLRAIDALQNFVEAYPSHPKASRAEQQVVELVTKLAKKEYDTAILYEKLENRESALVYYNTVIDRYYNTEYADDATAAKIRVLLRLRRFALAERTVKDFFERYPGSELTETVRQYSAELDGLRTASNAGN